MDSFVSQTEDVTIKRVAPNDNSSGEHGDKSPSKLSSSEVEEPSETSKAEEDPSPSESSETKDVVLSNPELELDLKPELKAEPSSPRCKTEPSPVVDESENISESIETAGDAQGKSPCKSGDDDNSEDFSGDAEEKDMAERTDEGLPEEDAGDSDRNPGVMNASQFLKMAAAEAAEKESQNTQANDDYLDEDQDEPISEEEDEPYEDDEFEEQPPDQVKSKKSRVDVKMESTAEDDPMDETEDVNGSVDDAYTGPEYEEDMERENPLPVKQEDGDDLSDKKPSLQSESDEKQGKAEEGNNQQEGPDIKKKLRTRQKRKILKEEDTDESEEERKKKRKKRKKKGDGSGTSEVTASEDDGSGKKKKKKKKKPGKKAKKKDEEGSGDEKEKKSTNMRRNIRDIMDETELDEATVAAQRQEMERLRRVQEQQRILREMAIQKQQQQRAEKVISILQGNTSILKQVSVSSSQGNKSTGSATSPNTVVVKVGSGDNKKVLELLRVPKGTSAEVKPAVTKSLLAKPESLQGTTMMTPSVSIAPVRPSAGGQKPASLVKQPSLIQAQASYSASEGEEDEDDEGEVEGVDDEEEEGEEEIGDEVDEEGKKKKKDVVTISSSSEDDCIVLSEPSDIDEDEAEEDPTNSGMHTNDAYNVPDEEGRVQVNMGKPEKDPDIFLAPHIARIIKPHQIGGIRFLYDNIIESIERFEASTGFGCILAHSMGLGKTLQVITFCDIFLRHTPAKTVMCIMPINTLQNWLAEFNMWMPDDPMATPLAAQGEVRPRTFAIHVLNDSHKTLKARAKVIDEWSTKGGVLLIGYELYRQLSLKKMSKPKKSRRKRPPASDEEEVDPEEEEKRQKEILEKVYEAIVKPGPDLVICDEGHRIKNSHASISVALKQIRSKRRVVLTGYPLQNNLLEYWCMVDFVRPNYLGTKTEFCNMFERPIQNGQCIDSTPQDIRLMRYRAHVLHSLLEGFVQRRSHSVLQAALPQKEEYVLLVRMTEFQRKLYDTFMNEVVRTKAVPNPLKAFAVCCKIWNHPDVLYQFLKKREGGEGIDLDLEEAAAALAANTVTDPTGTPVEEQKATPKSRGRSGSSKSRKKKETSPNKPAAAVLPNTSSQSDPSNPYGLSSQYPMHGQVNSSSMMGPYNPYGAAGQAPYGGFSGPHHYNPSSSYSHPGYSGTSSFNSSSASLGLNTAGQGSFPSSSSSGYGDSLGGSPASQSSQYGSSSSQSMFSGSTPSTPSASSSSGYGSMGPPYFSGNSSSAQHSMTDGFSSSSNYSQGWSGSSSYNSFNQGPSSSQPFSGSTYNSSGQTPSFQGYSGSNPSSSFNQSMYSSGSSSSSTNPSQPYQPGIMDQQLLDQALMAPPNRPSLNPNLVPQQSPVNASGMLPGGAPTKNSSMMPPNMGSSLMGPSMGVGMNNTTAGLGSMGDNLMGHPSQGMGMSTNVYQTPNMMTMPGQPPNHAQTGPMATVSSMPLTDVPPTAEDLLRATSDDFSSFNSSLPKPEASRSMFDPWGDSHSHSQDFNMIGGNQDMKPLQNSATKKLENDKFNPGPSPLDQPKNERDDLKSEEKPSAEAEINDTSVNNDSSHADQDAKGTDASKSWRVDSMEIMDKDKEGVEEKEKEGKDDEAEASAGSEGKTPADAAAIIKQSGKEDPGIPYDWAIKLMEDYAPGRIENAAKMVLFFCILEEALALGDRILLFSQSLFTLSLIEEYLQRSFIPVPGVYERWQRNRTYFRLDGSTAPLEREKLINEFNANPNVYLFLVSTRAGSLGINLVGANRVIVFDASWNPCHDTQAVCRVYRYGQRKPCYVYRFVMDSCLEKKIYDRQINKQGMSDRIVDECNPDAHLSIKDVTNLCWDDEKEAEVADFSSEKDKYSDPIMQKLLDKHSKLLTKAPFQHESLLVDRKDKKLSQAEKRLAKRSYEMEKRANNKPVYNYYNPAQGGLQIRPLQRDAAGNVIKPIASVRPMQSEINSTTSPGNRNTKWIPAEVWQRQGMSAQEMTLPLDVVIPTNSPERSSIVLKAGQRVMVLKSPKGIYMQLENGKIIAIRTAFKMGANNKTENKPFAVDKDEIKKGVNVNLVNKGNIKLTSGIHPLRNNPNITITPRAIPGPIRAGIRPNLIRPPGARMQTTANMRPWIRPGGIAGRAVPLRPGQNLRPGLRGLSPSVSVTPANAKSRTLGPVTITPRPAPVNFPGMKTPTDKDLTKIDAKADTKADQEEKLEKEDASNSNSHADLSAPLRATDDSASKSEEKLNEAEKAKELLQRLSKPESRFDPSVTKVAPETKLDLQKDTSGKFNALSGQDLSRNSMSDIATSLKNFHHASSSHGLNMQNVSGRENRESNLNSTYSGNSMYVSSEKNSQPSSLAYPGNFSSTTSLNKAYSSNVHGGNMLSSTYKTSADLSSKDSKSSSIENHWKSSPAPLSFASGVPSSKSSSQHRNQENSTYDDKSSASAHSTLSSKTSSIRGSNLESRSQSSSDSSLPSFAGTDLSLSHGKSSSKHSSAQITSSNQSSPANPKPSSNSVSSSIPTPSSSTNFSALDPYANLYGSYGAYSSSNYYNPYSYPTGFLPDPKSSLSSKTSTETNQSTSVPPSRSSSKPPASRSDSKTATQESSRSLPSAYDSRQGSSSASSNTHSSRSSSSTSSSANPSGSSSKAPESTAYSSSSSAAAAASAYNPMMMSPSFNPTSCQYPPPAAASGSTNPFTAAAAAAANYPSPYASPYGYPGANQFESEIARASMYSAFHRPEGGLDPTSPYLPLPAHSRPVTGTPASAGSFYSQNVYGSQYGGTRDPYAQLPYPASPLFMPPGPYGGLASSASSTATSDQSSSQS